MIVWDEKTNSRDEVQNIKVNAGDTVEMDFNTALIPNSLLNAFQKIQGNEYAEFGYRVKILSIIIVDQGNLTTMKFLEIGRAHV